MDRTEKTIADYGEQWAALKHNEGYYASVELLRDILEPLVPVESIRGLRVGEIGSGTGRIVRMLLDAGVSHVVAVEPSSAFRVLLENTRGHEDKITYHNVRGDQVPKNLDLDLVCAIGVIHHIDDPMPTLVRMRDTLRPGGRIFIWVYGYEGNELYLSIFGPLRALTTRIPDRIVGLVSNILTSVLQGYVWLCRFAPLPMRGYMRNVLAHYDRDNLYLTVFDQLNPEVARYYKREEAQALLEEAGFREIRIHHRHGYSWAVTGLK